MTTTLEISTNLHAEAKAELQHDSCKPTSRRLKLAYITTEYPKASHTFVRREIVALEELGHSVERFSVRSGGAVVDPADIEEKSKTTYLLKQNPAIHVACFLLAMVTRPVRFCKAIAASYAMWKCSDRGLIRHAAYLVEATTMLRLLKQKQVQHVHAHFGKNSVDVARLVHILGGPTYSMTIHGPGEFDGPRTFSLGPKVADSLFTVAITSYATAQLRRWVDYKHWNKLNIIHCAINDSFLDAKEELQTDSNQFVCVGRLTAQKGQLLLIDAVADVIQSGTPIRLVLAGDGEMRDAIEERIAVRGIGAHVHITGWIGEQDVRRHLLESRAMVLPSFAEGLPVAIMESFALGRPVIASTIAGIPELVSDRKNGWLVTSGSTDDLTRAFHEALETPLDIINQMGRHGQKAVRKEHHAATEATKLATLFAEHVAVNVPDPGDRATGS